MTIWRSLRASALKYYPAEPLFGSFEAKTMRTMMLPVFLLLGLAVRAEDSIYFDGPKDAKKEDLAKCASAMAKRMEGAGYEGISGSVEEKDGALRVELKCETGWTAEMAEKAKNSARVAAQKVELRFTRGITDAEREQFKPGRWDEPSKDKAPKGFMWARTRTTTLEEACSGEGDSKRGPVMLVKTEPLCSKADFGKLTKIKNNFGSDECDGYFLSQGATKKLQAQFRDEQEISVALWIDDHVLAERLTVSIRYSTTALDRAELVVNSRDFVRNVEPAIQNPMPFALTMRK